MLTDTVHFQLDPAQAAIADCHLRRLASIMCIMGARGSGKSSVLRALILMDAIMAAKRQILYFSQSTSNSNDQFWKLVDNPVVQQYLYAGLDLDPYTTKPNPTLRFANGSTVLFFSLEDHSGKLGYHPHRLYVDEAQSIAETAWSRTIFPMRVRVGTPAPIIVSGSCPESDSHWFWALHDKGKSNIANIKSFSLTPENALAFRSPAGKQFLIEARETMAEKDFDTEFRLIPGGQGEKYFKLSDIDACVKAYDPASVDVSKGTIMALDPALGRQDPQAILVMDLKGNVVLSYSIPKDMPDTDQIALIVEMATKWKSLVVVESNSTAYMTYMGALKSLLPYGVRDVPMRAISTKSQEGKNLLCKQLAFFFEKKIVRINPECRELIKQLKSIRDYKTPSGGLLIKAPDRDHDDEFSCLVVAAEALAKEWSPELDTGRNPAAGLY